MTSGASGPGDLLRAAAAGDRGSWELLVDRFVRLLWSVARTYRLSDADTADAVQTTWLRLVENLDRIKQPDRVGAWLVTTVRNECLLVLRRAGRETPTIIEWVDEPVDDAAAPDAALLSAETDTELRIAFGGLSSQCRELLGRLLLHDPPLDYRRISVELGVPIGSIGPTRARCLARLRELIDAAGISRDTGESQLRRPQGRERREAKPR